jgi:hypothetical protein
MINASNCAALTQQHANAMQFAPTHVVADTGATLIFVMMGAPAKTLALQLRPFKSAYLSKQR